MTLKSILSFKKGYFLAYGSAKNFQIEYFDSKGGNFNGALNW